MTVLGVVPARFASTRLPGKPLVELSGKPMIQRVWERVASARSLDEVLVATDDERVRERVLSFGGQAVMTSPQHSSGTDRVAEVALSREADVIVNVQGDEPLIDPNAIDAVVAALEDDDQAALATLASPIEDPDERADPHVVKVTLDHAGRALYFSRAPIPWQVDPREAGAPALRHVGLYAYRRDALRSFVGWPPSPLERSERLEQLRALENGLKVRVIVAPHPRAAVDTPEDVALVERELRRQHEGGRPAADGEA